MLQGFENSKVQDFVSLLNIFHPIFRRANLFKIPYLWLWVMKSTYVPDQFRHPIIFLNQVQARYMSPDIIQYF